MQITPMRRYEIRLCIVAALFALTVPAMAQSCEGKFNADRTVTGADLGVF